MKKGTVICIQFPDGSTQYANVLYVNGNTLTVHAADGYIYEVPSDSRSGRNYLVSA